MATPNPIPNKNDFDNLSKEHQRLLTRLPPLILPREQKALIYNLVTESKEFMTNDDLRNKFFSIINNIYLYAPLDPKQLSKLDELRKKIPQVNEPGNLTQVSSETKAEFNKQLEQFCIFFEKQKPKDKYRSYEEYKNHMRDANVFFAKVINVEQTLSETYKAYTTKRALRDKKQFNLDNARFAAGSLTEGEITTMKKEVETLEDEAGKLKTQQRNLERDLEAFKKNIIMKIQLADMLPLEVRPQAIYEIFVATCDAKASKEQVDFLIKYLNNTNHPLFCTKEQFPSYITLDSIQQIFNSELGYLLINLQIKKNPEPWARLLRKHLTEHSPMKLDDPSFKKLVAILKEIQCEKGNEEFKKAFAPELNFLRWRSVADKPRSDSVGELRHTGTLLAQQRPSLVPEPLAHTPTDQSPISPASKNSPAASVLRMSSIISPPIAQPAASTDIKPPELEKHSMGKNG